MIATGSAMPKLKLKIKFPSQKVEASPAPQSYEWDQQPGSSCDGRNTSSAGNSKETSSAFKRRPEGMSVGGPPEKRRKMDRCMTQQCSALLKALMKHPAGWVFNKPVDPKALGIPDYFSIIKNPMDLGTVKSKLAKNIYIGTDEFVADIRLTFSNAMLYNPPSNNVHKMAKEMKDVFEARWKSLEEKCNEENLKIGKGKIMIMRLKDVNESRQSCPKTLLYRNSSLPKKSRASEEKVAKVPLNVRAAEVELPKMAQNCVSKLAGKSLQRGTATGSGGFSHGSINAKSPVSPGASRCSFCGSIKCQCSLPNDSFHASSSDMTSERSLGGDLRVCSADVSELDSQGKSTLTSQMSKSDQDSNGDVSALDDENVCNSSQLTTPTPTDAASGEGLSTSIFDVRLSPKKALRAAMLKTRFADTILKAQQRALLDHCDKTDPVKLQQEKERLERRQREEKAKIEAQIVAAEAAAKMKAEVELKKQREREREAARIELQKMEKTAEIEQNLEILKELEMLSGCSLSNNQSHDLKKDSEKVSGALYEGIIGNPLQQLGLFIKAEYSEDEDDEDAFLNEDGEEGEILS
ncbi:bidirectional sugar transporter SWEET2a-like isoform X1 [Hibiscus syriacus]|uniref:Bidirectional sugar transporter SWEET2a-like isoform X1 n=1 Tax=Hibiscus syriacus TaxID=106335 RepID=A0A6A3D020_HIBSY|nr:transcription factor GTE12-like [Hibiscus syriacus]XP_039006451.1 transcription factor GTE12-like [Hibiscus syriacus]KAE8732699.1 bidirectional sugar transporter SWEET2a-like isoform X1 [Hibiscus syriacus]